ncbi:MAG: presenilin family intramembrane aspartyl protease [archaeon]
MKHTLQVTLFLVVMFFLAQIIGLAVINEYIDHKTTTETGEIAFTELPYGLERPEIEQGTAFIFYLTFAIVFGTLLVLLLVKLKKPFIWRMWLLFAIVLCMSLAFGAFIHPIFAFILAFILGLWKILKPNPIIHNATELFIYGGLAAIFVPIAAFTVPTAFLVLLLISLYDMYAVWKSKHMVTLANFQTQSKVFAGLSIPYTRKPKKGYKLVKGTLKTAILGGGDIGFPLMFAGVIMKDLMLKTTQQTAFLTTLIIPVFVSIALYILLTNGKKDKFYPAMPFLSLGCLAGYLVILLL